MGFVFYRTCSLSIRSPEIAAGLWNDLIVGAIVLILGVWAALASPRAAV
jgi:hypothetical protein